VNIDHVATVRQARRTIEPDPVQAAVEAEASGADQITVHLREDRRHIQDHDLQRLKAAVGVRLNLECACVDEMLKIACDLKPDQVCLVPEKREEVTTEGGLDVVGNRSRVERAVRQLQQNGIMVSLFIDPNEASVSVAKALDVEAVELHTGAYADAPDASARHRQLEVLTATSRLVRELGLHLHAGHGLTYTNVVPVARIEGMEELNIGHSIVSRSIFVGIGEAVREMKRLIS
jgi:pyridoxine 5-phosphate synthase